MYNMCVRAGERMCAGDYIYIVIVHPITVSAHICCDIIICYIIIMCESIINHFLIPLNVNNHSSFGRSS